MAFTDSHIIHYLNKIKPPYNISSINQKTASVKLARLYELNRQVRRIKKEKEILVLKLLKMEIIEKVYPSDSNFVLVKVKNADYIYNALVDMNIITRNRSSVVSNCIRITVGKPSENKLLVEALKKIKT